MYKRQALAFLPGTYGTSLIRNHALNGVLTEVQNQGIPEEVVEEIRSSLDCNIQLLGDTVDIPQMYIILACLLYTSRCV